MQKLKSSAYRLFLLFLTFVAGGWIYYEVVTYNLDSKGIQERYVRELRQKEARADRLIDEVKTYLLRGGEVSMRRLFGSDKFRPGSIYLYVFRNDSLVYWSDIEAPVGDDFDISLNDPGLLHLENGWYESRMDSADGYRILSLIQLKHDYLYQNQHIRNDFADDFNIPQVVRISGEKGEVNIETDRGDFLHSLVIPDHIEIPRSHMNIMFVLFLTGYLLFIGFLVVAHKAIFIRYRKKWIFLTGVIFDIILTRILISWLEIPGFLHDADIFGSEYFATSYLFPSLGDFLLNAVVVLVSVYLLYKYLDLRYHVSGRAMGIAVSLLHVFAVIAAYHLTLNLVSSLIIDSSIPFDLNNISLISAESLVGFVIMALLVLSFFLFAHKLLLVSPVANRRNERRIVALLAVITALAYTFLFDVEIYHFIFIILILLPVILLQEFQLKKPEFAGVLYFLVLFSLISTLLLYENNRIKEMESRKLMAIRLSRERDPVAEFKFSELDPRIQADAEVRKLAAAFERGEEVEQELVRYLKKKYFSGFWGKYDMLITVCDSMRMLDVQPGDFLVECYEYFDELIESYGRYTLAENLYFLDFEFGIDNYIARLNLNPSIRAYIEFYFKEIPRGPGYPELLIDEEIKTTSGLSEYSWARYKEGNLVYNFGSYFYSMDLDQYGASGENMEFMNRGGYNHMVYHSGEYTYIISKKLPGFLGIIAPFSYLFLFFGMIFFVAVLMFKAPVHPRLSEFNFRKRLQVSFVSLILFSFIFTGIASLLYLIRLNDNKNYDILSEKAHSVLIELEHKLADEDEITVEMKDYLEDLLYKFSLVFFSDINLYDLDGTLLAGSRSEIFSKGLISSKINPDAYYKLRYEDRTLFVHNEQIGNYNYLSAYLPFRNRENRQIAILNLPYFARQEELASEISTFLVAFVNIYVILIVLSIVLALVISSYIAKPLQLIREKIRRIKLGKANEKIEWKKRDEIGGLVAEYNRMIDELERSAELLAQSERESAWREMARQVAHEIKNPLTPMKLSVQMLKKAWEEKDPDWEKRLQRFTRNIIGQIESLSIIASEFSNFAKMPVSRNRRIEITSVLQNAVDLFMETTPVRIELYADPEQNLYVIADKEQLLRVFNNLIKNSIQAIHDQKNGWIRIIIKSTRDQVIISFSDNGIGIPEEQQARVFSPNFTTKSGGMGLGLAVTKNIILNAGGEIDFESEEGKGATFIIRLPLATS